MLNQFSLAEIISYGIMALLLARAIAHRFEARALKARLRPLRAELREIVYDLRAGAATAHGLAGARQAAMGLALADAFRGALRSGDSIAIKERVDDAIGAQFGVLYDACEQNELTGPRWGLLFTSFGIVLALMSAGRTTGSPPSFELSGVALAMINTGLGLAVAIIERATLAQHVVPLANDLRELATRILVETGQIEMVHHLDAEAIHAT